MDQENRMPLIGDKAPSFEAVTTQGPIKFPEDYAGKWVILFSHPADFTPVCTTEFMTFATMADEFKALNTELKRKVSETVEDAKKAAAEAGDKAAAAADTSAADKPADEGKAE